VPTRHTRGHEPNADCTKTAMPTNAAAVIDRSGIVMSSDGRAGPFGKGEEGVLRHYSIDSIQVSVVVSTKLEKLPVSVLLDRRNHRAKGFGDVSMDRKQGRKEREEGNALCMSMRATCLWAGWKKAGRQGTCGVGWGDFSDCPLGLPQHLVTTTEDQRHAHQPWRGTRPPCFDVRP
jgi:hypothetical protein